MVLAAVSSPSPAPPLVASVDIRTVGRDDTGVGHPQDAPRLACANPAADTTASMAVRVIFEIVDFIFLFFVYVLHY
jgi:hypothetical protein